MYGLYRSHIGILGLRVLWFPSVQNYVENDIERECFPDIKGLGAQKLHSTSNCTLYGDS